MPEQRAPFIGANDNYCPDYFLHEPNEYDGNRFDAVTLRYFDPRVASNDNRRTVTRRVYDHDKRSCYCSTTMRKVPVSLPRISILEAA